MLFNKTEDVNILTDYFLNNTEANIKDISDKLESDIISYSDDLSKVDHLRYKIGRPDLDADLYFFNIQTAITPFGKLMRCIAEIEDRLRALNANEKFIKKIKNISNKDSIDKNTLKNIILELQYVKGATSKLKFLSEEAVNILDTYFDNLELDEKNIAFYMFIEKIYKLLHSFIMAVLNNDIVRLNNIKDTLSTILYTDVIKLQYEISKNYDKYLEEYNITNRLKILTQLYQKYVYPNLVKIINEDHKNINQDSVFRLIIDIPHPFSKNVIKIKPEETCI